jgi:hypothetical protein
MNYKTVFLLLTFQIISIYTFCQDVVPEIIDTPFVTIDTLSIILDLILLPPADSLQDIKDEKRSSKAKKAFQFFSYLKYADKETGEFTGIEKYKKYKGKKNQKHTG